MSLRPFAEQERELLKELADLFAFRAERESQIAARLRAGTAGAEREHREAVGAARAAFNSASREAREEHGRVKAGVESTTGAELDAVTRAAAAELAEFQSRTQALAKNIAARMQQSKWLAETMVESADERVRPAFEATQRAVARKLEEFAAIEAEAGVVMARIRRAAVDQAPAESQAETGPVLPEALDAAIRGVRDTARRLRRAVHPRLLRSDAVAGLVFLGALVGAGVAGGRAWMAPATAISRALPGAGIGAGGATAMLVVYLLVSRLWVRPATRALAWALDHARLTAVRVERSAEIARDEGIASLKSKAKEEMARAQAAVAPYKAEVENRRSRLEPQLRAGREASTAKIQQERKRLLAENDKRLADRLGALEAGLATATGGADEILTRARQELETADRTDRDGLEQTWTERIAASMRQADELARTATGISPPWNAPIWDKTPAAVQTPPGVRFGSMRLDLAALPGGLSADPRLGVPGPTVRDLPLMVDLTGKGSVLLRAASEQREAAIDVLNNLTLRLLTGLPPGKARFTLVDPVGLGQSFAGLMHLSDYEKAIVGERIWTEPAHIDQRLTDLTEHMETVIQKYLRNQYESIQAYNAVAGEVAEPYRFLVIADFPAGISDVAAKRLASIATSGARCGVFMLVMTTRPGPEDQLRRSAGGASVPWAEVAANSMVLQMAPDGARWAEDPFAALPLALERAPDEAAASKLLHQIGEHVRDSTRVRLGFPIVEPGPEQVWSGDAAAELRLPLGRAGAKKLQYMSLGRGTSQHALIAGRTGSGKSTLLHVIITTAALWYGPDEVEFYLVDFKKGVEFKTYATHRLPHARVVAVESEREFGLSVLKSLDEEMNRRGALFRDAGVQDLAAFRRRRALEGDAAPTPRILLIVDEFQEFFVEDDKLAQDAGLLLDRLVRQGRAFGMHVILGSQTLAGAYTPARSTLGQMAVRIALQCSEADSYLIMSEDNPAARLLSRPGEAIYNDANGMLEANSPFQIVWLPDEVREQALDRVRKEHAATGRPQPAQLVFEGNAPADMAANPMLAALIDRRETRPPAPVLWLGEPLSIKGPTGIPLHAQSAANALIVGSDEERALAMSSAAVLSLAAWLRAGSARDTEQLTSSISILDATPPDHPHAGLLPALVNGLGGLARMAGPRQAPEALAELGAEIDRREASGAAKHAPVLLVVHGLQRFRELRKSDEFSFAGDAGQSQTPAQLLAKVLRAGPPVGVHALVWCDTATNLDRTLERAALREFNGRALMQMSGGDSTQLIENQGAATLGPNRALLYQDETGMVERFRPYATPTPEWLAGVAARIAAGDRAGGRNDTDASP